MFIQVSYHVPRERFIKKIGPLKIADADDFSCLGLNDLAKNGYELKHPDHPSYTAVPL